MRAVMAEEWSIAVTCAPRRASSTLSAPAPAAMSATRSPGAIRSRSARAKPKREVIGSAISSYVALNAF
jgi:hypothetical protein